MEGKNWSLVGGMLVGYTYSDSWIDNDDEAFNEWETHNVQMLGISGGANWSVGETYVPFVW